MSDLNVIVNSSKQCIRSVSFALAMFQCIACSLLAAEPTTADVAERFDKQVQPFLRTYCVSCHGGTKPKSDLDLSTFTSVDAVTNDHARWALDLDRLKTGDMPPEDATPQPSPELLKETITWIENARTL